MKFEDALIKTYGPLLTVAQLAQLLDRSVEGLRTGLRSENDWTRKINASKLKLGRRIYFRTSDIAKLLSDA